MDQCERFHPKHVLLETYYKNLIHVYSCVVESIAQCNKDQSSHVSTSPFHAATIPSISIERYVSRIAQYFQCSLECFICSLVYINSMLLSNEVVINMYSIHRVILVTIMEAAKFYDDSFFNNQMYARIGGIPVDELNFLEIEFVFKIHFALCISAEDYFHFHHELELHCDHVCEKCHNYHLPSMSLIHPVTNVSYLVYSDSSSEED